MRRARWILAWNLLLLVMASTALADGVDYINGIGLIDYSSHPNMKVGSWVKYHVTGASQLGASDDYDVTVMIAGEERFWGEDCFWVETWTEPKGRPPIAVATLMSYSVFSDTLPTIRSQYYMRKTINGLTPEGGVQENLVRRPAATLKKRETLTAIPSVSLDTLDTQTFTLDGQDFACRKVSWKEGKSATLDQRDSSLTTEVRENRMLYLSKKVPVTGLFREDIEHSTKRKTWAIGRSADAAPFNVMDIAKGTATLVAFGDHEKPRLLPLDRERTLADFDASGRLIVRPASAKGSSKTTPAKAPAPKKKS